MKYIDYNEKKLHGSYEFPIQYYYEYYGEPRYIMSFHWHKEFEIIRVISGKFTLYLNNNEYEMKKGDIGLIECGVLHRGEPEECVYECIVFDLNMLRRHTNDIISSYISPIANGDMAASCVLILKDSTVYNAANAIFSEIKSRAKYYELNIYSLLFRLFAELYSSGNIVPIIKNKRSRHQTKTVTELIDWIEANYTEPITLRDLSKISGVSGNYLCGLFKQFTTKTPMEYINNVRIEAVCRHMLSDGHSATEAAFESGFNDFSYFSRVFKKYKGVSPGKFKRNGNMSAGII